MRITLDLDQVATLLATSVALITGVGYLAHKARQLYRYLRAAALVIHRELTPNSGSSIKDDVDGLALSFGALSRLVDDIDERLNHHLEATEGNHP